MSIQTWQSRDAMVAQLETVERVFAAGALAVHPALLSIDRADRCDFFDAAVAAVLVSEKRLRRAAPADAERDEGKTWGSSGTTRRLP